MPGKEHYTNMGKYEGLFKLISIKKDGEGWFSGIYHRMMGIHKDIKRLIITVKPEVINYISSQKWSLDELSEALIFVFNRIHNELDLGQEIGGYRTKHFFLNKYTGSTFDKAGYVPIYEVDTIFPLHLRWNRVKKLTRILKTKHPGLEFRPHFGIIGFKRGVPNYGTQIYYRIKDAPRLAKSNKDLPKWVLEFKKDIESGQKKDE